jgi:hypothetical protein
MSLLLRRLLSTAAAAAHGPPPIRVALTDSAGRGIFATRPIAAGEVLHSAHPSRSLLHEVSAHAFLSFFCPLPLPQDQGFIFDTIWNNLARTGLRCATAASGGRRGRAATPAGAATSAATHAENMLRCGCLCSVLCNPACD